MGFINVIRAIIVRLAFAGHGIIAIWRLYMLTSDVKSLYLGASLGGLFLESCVTICGKNGKEWKWVCPSVFFYLTSVVPAIWFMELHEMEKRISTKLEGTNATAAALQNETTILEEDLTATIESLGLKITIPLKLPPDLWLRVIEQFLLLMLIIGRWLLPKGALTHEQLSQLLLVYVGTAADIVEFYEAFNEEGVKHNRLLCYIILGVWTASLLQFTLVLTASRARRDQSGVPSAYGEREDTGCCNPEIYGILTSICLQDLPFLVVRLLLILHYNVVSYTNMFFTSKNSLVIILLIYRLCVVQVQASKAKEKTIHQISTPLTVSRTTSEENGRSRTTLLQINEKPNYRSRSPRNSLRPSPQPSPAGSPRTLPRGSCPSLRMGSTNPSLLESPTHSAQNSPHHHANRNRAHSVGRPSPQNFLFVERERVS